MIGSEVVGKKLYDAASQGDLTTFQEFLQQDPYLLDVISFACSRNLLHIATMRGKATIVEEVLKINPQLARVLDSQKSSSLHIAAAQGHVEIAIKLLAAAPEMCWWRDGQGMNPVHIAAMNGHVEILEELIRRDPFPAREKVGRGESVLHLCVKHGQLRALQILVDNVNLGELVRAEDDYGDTVLHLAVRYKKLEIIQYVVKSNKIDERSRNSKGKTALQILQESPPHTTNSAIRKILATSSQIQDVIDRGLVDRMSSSAMVVAILIATIAFQSVLSPPGGVWQEDLPPLHQAGEAVMASNRPKIFKIFLHANTVAFAFSMITIFFLSINFSPGNVYAAVFSLYAMFVSLESIAVSYGASLMTICPNMEKKSLFVVIIIVIAVVVGQFLVVAAVRYLFDRWKKKQKEIGGRKFLDLIKSTFEK